MRSVCVCSIVYIPVSRHVCSCFHTTTTTTISNNNYYYCYYNHNNNPASTGRVTQRTIMRDRLNGQYIIEGIAAGTFACLAALGFVLLREAVQTARTKGGSIAMACGGAALLGVG